jgi:hypothetical protein
MKTPRVWRHQDSQPRGSNCHGAVGDGRFIGAFLERIAFSRGYAWLNEIVNRL